MRSLNLRSRRPVRSTFFESLESRQLLAANLFDAPAAINAPAGTSQTIDLANFINERIRFATSLGDIDLELFSGVRQITVDNFLSYVNQDRLDGTIIHRVTKEADGIEVIQGGGFTPFFPSTQGPAPTHITTDAPIVNEASVSPLKSNVRGTIAMARTNDPDSATSEWFINTADNTVLDAGPEEGDAGYAVFGRVIDDAGLAVADAIQALPIFTVGDPNQSALQATPLQNYGGTGDPDSTDYITLTASQLPTPVLTFSVQNNNPAVATATLQGTQLTLNFGPTVGVTNLQITATDAQNNTITKPLTIVTGQAETPKLPVTLGGQGVPTTVNFTDLDGTIATLSIRGAGAAIVNFEGEGLAQSAAGRAAVITGSPIGIADIDVNGAGANTAISILTRGGGDGVIQLNGLSIDATIRSVAAKTTRFGGSLNAAGSIKKLDLGDTNAATLNLGGLATDKPVTITLGNAAATILKSNAAVNRLTAASFTAGDLATAPQITLRSLSRFTVAGDLANRTVVNGNIKSMSVGGNLTGNISADSIGALTVGGDVTDVSIVATRAYAPREKPLGKVTVGGTMTRSLVRANGNVTSLTAGGLNRSIIVAGLTGNGATLPTSFTDFTAPAAIGNVTVKGDYVSSNIVGFTLGRINVGTLTAANSGLAFGIAGDRIAGITGSTGDGVLTIRNLDTAEDVTSQIGEANLGDFRISLVDPPVQG